MQASSTSTAEHKKHSLSHPLALVRFLQISNVRHHPAMQNIHHGRCINGQESMLKTIHFVSGKCVFSWAASFTAELFLCFYLHTTPNNLNLPCVFLYKLLLLSLDVGHIYLPDVHFRYREMAALTIPITIHTCFLFSFPHMTFLLSPSQLSPVFILVCQHSS